MLLKQQINILRCIGAYQPISQINISKKIALLPKWVSLKVRELESMGLLQRVDSSRRGKFYILTENGYKVNLLLEQIELLTVK